MVSGEWSMVNDEWCMVKSPQNIWFFLIAARIFEIYRGSSRARLPPRYHSSPPLPPPSPAAALPQGPPTPHFDSAAFCPRSRATSCALSSRCSWSLSIDNLGIQDSVSSWSLIDNLGIQDSVSTMSSIVTLGIQDTVCASWSSSSLFCGLGRGRRRRRGRRRNGCRYVRRWASGNAMNHSRITTCAKANITI